METQYHAQICQRALNERFSPRALEIITTANLGQDKLRGQFGHPEFHFDHNAFEASYAYMAEQHRIVLDSLSGICDLEPAWQAFGRLIHTGQDFYAHSNYLSLWADSYPDGELPPPFELNALDPKFLNHPQLASGKIYLWDWLAYLPGLYKLAMQILPKDSHGHMNLDHPVRGPLFPFAVEAAIQRTIHEFEIISSLIQQKLGAHLLTLFLD
jgi:hypothetical protein